MWILRYSRLFVAVLALLAGVASARAQEAVAAPGGELSRTRAELVDSTEEVKSSTEELLRLKESQVAGAERSHEQLRQLAAEGLVARKEVEESERALAAARAELERLRGQLAASDRLIAEVEAAEKLEKLQPLAPAGAGKLLKTTLSYSATATIIRHTGAANWTVANLPDVQAFFAATFKRPLPVSALGQTATHNRLGFDHRRAVDVALHPDSAEGRALIIYLQGRGITFMAFRAAVPGSATGPHIHIGPPSHRVG